MGLVCALHKWRISIVSQTTEDSNLQIYTSVTTEGVHILTGSNIINYFWSAANRVHVTPAVTDFPVSS